jgi:hypothetical protein
MPGGGVGKSTHKRDTENPIKPPLQHDWVGKRESYDGIDNLLQMLKSVVKTIYLRYVTLFLYSVCSMSTL